MKPEQLKQLKELEPDHHLSLDPGCKSWRVHAYGTYHLFPVHKHKSNDNAKAAALAFRDSLPAEGFELKKPLLHQARSGGDYVYRYTNSTGLQYWKAVWVEPDPTDPLEQKVKVKSKSFRIDIHGDEKAREMVLKYREKKVFEIGVAG